MDGKGKGKPMTEEEYKLNKQLFDVIQNYEPQYSKKSPSQEIDE
jgi:predicted transcriptional regulator